MFLEMSVKANWIKYLSPFIGMLFCPVTILFLWTILSGPVINSQTDLGEDVMPK